MLRSNTLRYSVNPTDTFIRIGGIYILCTHSIESENFPHVQRVRFDYTHFVTLWIQPLSSSRKRSGIRNHTLNNQTPTSTQSWKYKPTYTSPNKAILIQTNCYINQPSNQTSNHPTISNHFPISKLESGLGIHRVTQGLWARYTSVSERAGPKSAKEDSTANQLLVQTRLYTPCPVAMTCARLDAGNTSILATATDRPKRTNLASQYRSSQSPFRR